MIALKSSYDRFSVAHSGEEWLVSLGTDFGEISDFGLASSSQIFFILERAAKSSQEDRLQCAR